LRTLRWSKADSNSGSQPACDTPAATRFVADSVLEQRRFELSVPPGTPAFRGAPDGSRHRSRFRSRAAVIVTLAALPILWTPNVVVARMVVGGFRVVIPGALLFAADGWIVTGYVFVWQIALTRCRATRPRGSPGLAQTLAPLAGNRGFESTSLQRGVCEASVPRLQGPAPAEAARRTTATSSEQGFIARLARSGGEIERRGSGSHADPHRYYPIQQPV
jgi:hypothetical protein